MKYVLLFSALLNLSTAAFAADDIGNLQAPISAEYVNSCKGLSEKDSCQVHGKTNNLITGSCKTKAITPDNFDLVCVPEQVSKKSAEDSDAVASSDHGSHQQKHKR